MKTVKRKCGQPPIYPYASLEVGETCFVPWVCDEKGQPLLGHPVQSRLYHAMRQYGRRNGKEFRVTQSSRGRVVLRIR